MGWEWVRKLDLNCCANLPRNDPDAGSSESRKVIDTMSGAPEIGVATAKMDIDLRRPGPIRSPGFRSSPSKRPPNCAGSKLPDPRDMPPLGIASRRDDTGKREPPDATCCLKHANSYVARHLVTLNHDDPIRGEGQRDRRPRPVRHRP